MDLLKKENRWLWLIIEIFGQGIGMFILAALLKVYKKDAWYSQWYYWLIGVLCCFFPAIIMILVLSIQLTVECAKKLDVAGSEVYANPYVWIVGLIVPVLGWVFLAVMNIYLAIFIIVAIYKGKAERFIKN